MLAHWQRRAPDGGERREHAEDEAKVGALLEVVERPDDTNARHAAAIQPTPQLPHALILLRTKGPVLRIQHLDGHQAPVG